VSPPLELYLVRHTEADWNRERRYLGRSDRPLTPRGLRRAGALARRLARLRPERVWSSGLVRTDGLAEAIRRCGGPRPRRDPRWRELDHGRWEGLTWAEVEVRFPREARRRLEAPWRSRPRGGESPAALWRRVRQALDELRERQPQGRALVVTHAGPVQLLVCHALGASPESWSRVRVTPGGVTRIDLWRGGCALVALNGGATASA
jgi:2,3-bisphosphoglycerate-dependent phosphoglycerate mutase/probable phosphoglycerate mutase